MGHRDSNEVNARVHIPLATIAEVFQRACQKQLAEDVKEARKPRKPKAEKASGEIERLKEEIRKKDRETVQALNKKDQETDQERRDLKRELTKKDRELRSKNRLIRKNGN